MPEGSSSLRKYVRYYYHYYYGNRKENRVIKGVYISRSWLRKSEIPNRGIAFVKNESDIDVPQDAGCSVVFVELDLENQSKFMGSCSAEVVQ
jgi:hypothetical protein